MLFSHSTNTQNDGLNYVLMLTTTTQLHGRCVGGGGSKRRWRTFHSYRIVFCVLSIWETPSQLLFEAIWKKLLFPLRLLRQWMENLFYTLYQHSKCIHGTYLCSTRQIRLLSCPVYSLIHHTEIWAMSNNHKYYVETI